MELNQRLTQIIGDLVIEGDLEEALLLLKDKYSHLSDSIDTIIILNLANYNSLQSRIAMGMISPDNARVETSIISNNTLTLARRTIPKAIERNNNLKDIYQFENDDHLEKIIGEKNNLLKIKWLEQGIIASKSVCQIIRDDGDKGTGFVVEGGFLITNFHVLPTEQRAASAKIIFNYEEDIAGVLKKSTEYYLEPNTIIKDAALDYARVKIKDNPDFPISEWGFLKFGDSSTINKEDSVVIIQHALGETKQIASDVIIGKYKGKIYYTTDTEKGSSGSPVFNKDWEVIALHHAGKSESDGGYIIDDIGTRAAANEGIPIKEIMSNIKEQSEK